MKFPKATEVMRVLSKDMTDALRSRYTDWPVDVRLQVFETGQWDLHVGDASYDTDHHGYWGAVSIEKPSNPNTVSDTALELADDLIEQCKEAHTSGVEGPDDEEDDEEDDDEEDDGDTDEE